MQSKAKRDLVYVKRDLVSVKRDLVMSTVYRAKAMQSKAKQQAPCYQGAWAKGQAP